MIEFKNITKSYQDGGREHIVLQDINLLIRDSEFITIRGRSGGGKSTLLNMIALLLEPTSGKMIMDGHEIDWRNEKEIEDIRREKIGLVFQSPNLISCLTPLDNILLSAPKGSKARALELMQRVGLKGKEHVNIKALSGGEAQRVSIVRALVKQPQILLCDEPTGALDQRTGLAVIELLREIQQEEKCTIIMVTHDEKIAEMGTRKLLLEGGGIVEL